MARTGRTINIPLVEEFSANDRRFCAIKEAGFKGRAIKVLLKFVSFGVEKGWWQPKKVYKSLVWFGFDKGWISDLFLASITLEYGFKDMDWTKDKRLEKFFENGNGGIKNGLR